MQVVDTTRPFEGGLMALSSFGFGGANMHLVMDGHKAGQRLQLVTLDNADEHKDATIPLAARTADGLSYLANVILEASPALRVRLGTCTMQASTGMCTLRRQSNLTAHSLLLSPDVQMCSLLCRLWLDLQHTADLDALCRLRQQLVQAPGSPCNAVPEQWPATLSTCFRCKNRPCQAAQGSQAEQLLILAHAVQAEAADGVSFSQPLRRYANTVASDMRLSYRGTLTDGKLKAGGSATKAPEVRLSAAAAAL